MKRVKKSMLIRIDCSDVGGLGGEQQIPAGNDRKKSKSVSRKGRKGCAKVAKESGGGGVAGRLLVWVG